MERKRRRWDKQTIDEDVPVKKKSAWDQEVHVHTCVCVCVCVYVCLSVCLSMYTCVFVCVCVCMCLCLYFCVYMSVSVTECWKTLCTCIISC